MKIPDIYTPLLTEIGFHKRSGGIYTMPIEADVIGWVGLNTMTQHHPTGHVTVTPIVGVRHQRIEKLIADVRGQKVHPYIPPTISVGVGELTSQGRWTIDTTNVAGSSVDIEASVRAIAEFGVPFMRSNATLSQLLSSIEKGMGLEGRLEYRYPAALLEDGQTTKCCEVIDEALAFWATTPSAEQLREYLVRLRSRAASTDGLST